LNCPYCDIKMGSVESDFTNNSGKHNKFHCFNCVSEVHYLKNEIKVYDISKSGELYFYENLPLI